MAALRIRVTGRAGHASMRNDENPIQRLGATLAAIAGHPLKPTPTVLTSGEASNVVPAEAACIVDVRMPAGVSEEELIEELRRLAGQPEWLEIEVVKWGGATSSPDETSLAGALRAAIAAEDTGAEIASVEGRIGTDARPYREQGMACYGHIPFVLNEQDLRGMHGPDERVSIENLEHGLRIMARVVERLCL